MSFPVLSPTAFLVPFQCQSAMVAPWDISWFLALATRFAETPSLQEQSNAMTATMLTVMAATPTALLATITGAQQPLLGQFRHGARVHRRRDEVRDPTRR